MTRTYTLDLTDEELDVIYDALYEYKNSSESDVAEIAGEVMEKLFKLFVQSVVSKQQ
jgi:frataxin-like iron-binding protein CyaY